jgi:hypothetical protein
MAWLKGNLHAHTDASDGDSPAEELVDWYDAHGYDFLAITDHNLRLPTRRLQARLRRRGSRMLLVPGEELTTWWKQGERTYALHVNGWGTRRTLGGADGRTVTEVLQASIDRVVGDGGVAGLNHPNFWESVTYEDIAALPRLTHFELYNGHPLTYSMGTDRLPSMEATWDRLLSAGRPVFGVAVDDTHYLGRWGADVSNPGRGWVAVEVGEPRDRAGVADILRGLRAGRFYASTGPELRSVSSAGGELTVEAAEEGELTVVASGGEAAKVEGVRVTSRLPEAGYVRARLRSDRGIAWTQPFFASSEAAPQPG